MRRILSSLAIAALAAACSSSGGATTPSAGTGPGVSIIDFEFQPKELVVTSGEGVTWTNNGGTAHSVEWPADGTIGWAEGKEGNAIAPGGSTVPLPFAQAGRYDYICGIHNNMQGTIIVE